MLFNSPEFSIFFLIVFCIYWLINSKLKYQNLLLLVASYVFYAWWDWRFLSLIIFSSVIDYTIGQKIYQADLEKERKRWLIASLISNLGLLGVFKYYNFFAESFSALALQFGWQAGDLTLNIILPIGISFYTFQTLSYTIDIYRKSLKPTEDIIGFFTYIAFFPQLVAGPIERASDLLPQIVSKRVFERTLAKEGIIQIFVGLFRKIVIADTLAVFVDPVFNNPDIYNSSTYILAVFFYAFQIYYDFSGYSDIAIGSAKLLGFKFRQNFDTPYFSKSLTEFWRKWHKSLSSWLRDYLYISLGGNRKGIVITYRNLLITMLLGGLWHGSHWNFIIWGGIHGLVLSVEKYLSANNYFPKLRSIKLLGWLLTFSIVLFAWIFFRSPDLYTAIAIINSILQFDFSMPFILKISVFINTLVVLSLGIAFDFYLYKKKMPLENFGAKFSTLQLVVFITILISFINLFYSSSNNFIYFQF